MKKLALLALCLCVFQGKVVIQGGREIIVAIPKTHGYAILQTSRTFKPGALVTFVGNCPNSEGRSDQGFFLQ